MSDVRIFTENQAWVEPQSGPVSHPGTGLQGHIHVGTAFPWFQTVTEDVLPLDIRVQFHNVPGIVKNLRVGTYTPGEPPGSQLILNIPVDDCPTVDCDTTFHVDYPLSDAPLSGWTEFYVSVYVDMVNSSGVKTGQEWYNLYRGFLDIQNGAPPRNTPLIPPDYVEGDSWFTAEGGSKYSAARIKLDSFPFDMATGLPVPVSGIWQPKVWFNRDIGRVIVDPHLHDNPPDLGVEIWQGIPVEDTPNSKWMALTVDTTQFANGAHRMLLIGTDTHRPSGIKSSGVLVVPFTVANDEPDPEPADVILEPGQVFIVDSPTGLTGVVDANRAVLTAGG